GDQGLGGPLRGGVSGASAGAAAVIGSDVPGGGAAALTSVRGAAPSSTTTGAPGLVGERATLLPGRVAGGGAVPDVTTLAGLEILAVRERAVGAVSAVPTSGAAGPTGRRTGRARGATASTVAATSAATAGDHERGAVTRRGTG